MSLACIRPGVTAVTATVGNQPGAGCQPLAPAAHRQWSQRTGRQQQQQQQEDEEKGVEGGKGREREMDWWDEEKGKGKEMDKLTVIVERQMPHV